MTKIPNVSLSKPNDDLLVGADEIGKFLNCNKRRAFYLLETRQVPAFKIGKLWHARRSTLLRFMERQEQASGAPSATSG